MKWPLCWRPKDSYFPSPYIRGVDPTLHVGTLLQDVQTGEIVRVVGHHNEDDNHAPITEVQRSFGGTPSALIDSERLIIIGSA